MIRSPVRLILVLRKTSPSLSTSTRMTTALHTTGGHCHLQRGTLPGRRRPPRGQPATAISRDQTTLYGGSLILEHNVVFGNAGLRDDTSMTLEHGTLEITGGSVINAASFSITTMTSSCAPEPAPSSMPKTWIFPAASSLTCRSRRRKPPPWQTPPDFPSPPPVPSSWADP